jgi:Squalene-hopene cyclase C-terminal domain
MDLLPAVGLASEAMAADSEEFFRAGTCLPFLRNAQNEDGGWGFHPGAVSRAEPSCWALLALLQSTKHEDEEAVTRGVHWLGGGQLVDGPWPSTPGQQSGCWVTSLVCLVLCLAGDTTKNSAEAVARGLRWLCADWPQDSTPWRRFLAKFAAQRQLSAINNAYRGWGWTPGTSSWVEPTSFALLALERAPREIRPGSAKRRRDLAEAMLYDRMCPGGGWNCGNPSVYGVAGEPLIVPTTMALLALRAYPQRAENRASLEWLEREVASIDATGSLALARIALAAYGRDWPSKAPGFSDLYANSESLQSIQVVAWMCLALGRQDWLLAGSGEAQGHA